MLTRDTPIGRKVLPKAGVRTSPLIRVKPVDLQRAGVTPVPRTVGVVDLMPQLVDDGRILEVTNVIWCTGFRPDFPWLGIDGPDLAAPLSSTHGAVLGHPGLFLLGQEFQHAFNPIRPAGSAATPSAWRRRSPRAGSPCLRKRGRGS